MEITQNDQKKEVFSHRDMVKILQKRHIIDKQLEYLVKIRNLKKMKEVWIEEEVLRQSLRGKELLNLFNKTKVASMGVDMFLGKRKRSSNLSTSFGGFTTLENSNGESMKHSVNKKISNINIHDNVNINLNGNIYKSNKIKQSGNFKSQKDFTSEPKKNSCKRKRPNHFTGKQNENNLLKSEKSQNQSNQNNSKMNFSSTNLQRIPSFSYFPQNPSIASSPIIPEAGQRRSSIRQTEGVFHLKEVSVKKNSAVVELTLGSEGHKLRTLRNPFTTKALSELTTVLRNLRYDICKVVLFTGFGSFFTSGLDLNFLLNETKDRKMAAKIMAGHLKEFVNCLIDFPKPIVASVNGPCEGLGAAMLPLFDLVYASDKASFYCPFIRLGQTPEACSSFTFPKIMGLAMANEVLLQGRKITALEALQSSLVSQVFWPENLKTEVISRVQLISQQSQKALEETKKLIRNRTREELKRTNEMECEVLEERWASGESQRNMKTYLENMDL